jgi:hypothetical protein
MCSEVSRQVVSRQVCWLNVAIALRLFPLGQKLIDIKENISLPSKIQHSMPGFVVQTRVENVKLSLYLNKYHAMKTYTHYLIKHHTMTSSWGKIGIATCILNLGTRWKCVEAPGPGRFNAGERRRYPLVWRLDGPQSRSGCSGEDIKILSLPLPGIEPRRSLVTILTGLSRQQQQYLTCKKNHEVPRYVVSYIFVHTVLIYFPLGSCKISSIY